MVDQMKVIEGSVLTVRNTMLKSAGQAAGSTSFRKLPHSYTIRGLGYFQSVKADDSASTLIRDAVRHNLKKPDKTFSYSGGYWRQILCRIQPSGVGKVQQESPCRIRLWLCRSSRISTSSKIPFC